MRIDCPSCDAGYDLAPEQVPPGRGVRCARCGNVWAPVALMDATPPIPLPPEPRFQPAFVPGPTNPAIMTMKEEAPEPVAFERFMDEPDLPGELHVTPPPEPAAPVFIAPEPVVPEPVVPKPVVPKPAAAPALARRGIPLWGGWLATVLVLVAVGLGVVTYRSKITAAWPPSARAYGWVGLASRAK